MSEKNPGEIYDLEPDPEDDEPVAPASDGAPADQPEGLLEGFDEDDDFDRDPEVDAALGRAPKVTKVEVVAEEPPPLVHEGMGPWKLWAGIGAVSLVAALVLAAVYAPRAPVGHALLVIYNGLLHTGTGVAALLVGGVFLERRFGSVELAAARMFAAVGAFLLVFHLPIDLLTDAKLEEVVLGTLAYLLVVWLSFQLSRTALMVVVGAHFGLWFVVQLGMQLTSWVAAAPKPTT